jgi:hypothetical protein
MAALKIRADAVLDDQPARGACTELRVSRGGP